MKIAVDAMGGDYAPAVVIEGLTMALYDFPEYELVVVGHVDKLAYLMEKFGIDHHPRITKVHAEEVVDMSDPSTTALRGKRHSSINVCAKLMKEGKVDAVVSAGHTGAAVAACTVLVRTLPGISRPGLCVSMPAQGGRFILADGGANTDCDPVNLVQFALMGEIYSQFLFGIERPRIGLLSVGSEDIKGNDLTKQVFKMLSALPINFIGNVEGDNMFECRADVVVCDGFTGNIVLKTSEGLARSTMYWLKSVFTKNALRMTSAFLSKNAFRELKAFGDSEELGGAPLIGINGTCIIGHGSSSPKAVRNAIKMAGQSVKFGVKEKIAARWEEMKPILDAYNEARAAEKAALEKQ